MLVTLNEILPAARREHRAIGGFNIGNYETALAVIRGAVAANQPVIVQIYARLVANGHGEPLAAMIRQMAEAAPIPVVLHLDHGADLAQVERALKAGFTSVMLDNSQASYADNVAATKQVVALARQYGASVESEIGHVPFGDDAIAKSQESETVRFYEETQVDALAVSIGTAHGFYKQAPKLNYELCSALAEKIPAPLVLHGGSGTPRDQVREVIRRGIAKINVATEFQYDYQQKLRTRLNEVGDAFKAADLLEAPVVETSTAFIKEMIEFFAGK